MGTHNTTTITVTNTNTNTNPTTVSRPNHHHHHPNNHHKQAQKPLIKQQSWSPETHRDELWQKHKKRNGSRRSKSLTDDDLEELKACFELGFSFHSPEFEPGSKLSQTIPALDFYLTVNRTYNDTILKSSKSSFSSLSSDSDLSLSSPSAASSFTMFTLGEDEKTIKTRLRHWAQVVACSVKQTW